MAAAAQIFPLYDEWLRNYNVVKTTGMWGEAIEFVSKHPETVNNRNMNSRGYTLLHQAAYLGVHRSIVQQLKDLGADPTLRVYRENRMPADEALAEKNESVRRGDARRIRALDSFLEALTEAYGADFAVRRERLCRAAKDGAFPKVIQLLTARPELTAVMAKVQTEGGWSLLHHACFYEAGGSFHQQLRSLGCSADVRTHQGESCEDVLRKYHGQDSFAETALKEVYQAAAADAGALAVGAEVSFYAMDQVGVIRGTVTQVTEEEVFMTDGAGWPHKGPNWRFRVTPPKLDGRGDPDADDPMGDDEDDAEEKCCMCGQVTLSKRMSARCLDESHVLCTECTVTALKASWVSGAPLACSFCDAELDENDWEAIKKRRPLTTAWTEVHRQAGDTTFRDFVDRCARTKRVKWDALPLAERTVCQQRMARGEMMRCLNADCAQPFENPSGHDWVQCYFCRTEHNWQTKTLFWPA